MIPTSAQNGCDQVTRLIVQPSVGSPDYVQGWYRTFPKRGGGGVANPNPPVSAPGVGFVCEHDVVALLAYYTQTKELYTQSAITSV